MIYQQRNISTTLALIQTERLITRWGTILGAGGILISGWILSSIPQGPQWGWFDIQLYPWLALKQLLFVIILLLIVFDLTQSKQLAKRLKSKDADKVERSVKKWKAVYRLSMAVYILVIVSTLLGWYKPGLTTFG
jgi:hypothetical protein